MKIQLDPKSTDGGYVPPKANVPHHITVEQPHEPPAEVLKQEFKLDNDIFKHDASEGVVTIEDKSGNQTPAKMVDKTEEKKEEKVSSILKPPAGEKKVEPVKKEEKKEEKKVEPEVKLITPPAKGDKVVRDYAGYSEEEIAHFKQMSDAAYKWTTEQLKAKKEFEKNRDNTFLQHPEAYTLSPEFHDLRTKVILSNKEGNYWKQCLAQLDEGKPIKDLTGWDANGNPQFGQEYQPSKELEETVRMAMSQAYGTAQTFGAQLNEYPNRFKTQINTDLKAINDEQSKRFAWVNDPKLLDYTLDMGSSGEMSIKQIRESIINLFPPYMRNNPATDVAANLFVALRIQDAELREARNGKTLIEADKKDEERAEPSSDAKPGKQPEGIGGIKEFSLAGMPS